jgi:2-dehydro-3-deoxyphosphooctonate aldolase (KDO 8-P synthase)
MKAFGYPIVMDVTHSTQKPSALGDKSGGDRKYAPYMAKLANAVGVDGFFFEVHPNPEEALSDGPNMVYLKDFRAILESIA